MSTLKDRQQAQQHRDPDPIELLPFVATAPGGRKFWVIRARTGDHELDCCLGADLARRALQYMRRLDGIDATLLCWIISDMVKGGTFGSVEVGFVETVAKAAIGHAGPLWASAAAAMLGREVRP